MTTLQQTGTAVRDTRTLEICNPADGAEVGRLPTSTQAEVVQAVTAARVAHATWSRTAPAQRGEAVRLAAQALRDHVEALAELNEAETGKPPAAPPGAPSRRSQRPQARRRCWRTAVTIPW